VNAMTTSWIVVAVGAIVAAIGYYIGDMLGAGILGFGLAHVILGILDMFRPSVRARSDANV